MQMSEPRRISWWKNHSEIAALLREHAADENVPGPPTTDPLVLCGT